MNAAYMKEIWLSHWRRSKLSWLIFLFVVVAPAMADDSAGMFGLRLGTFLAGMGAAISLKD